MPTPTASRQPPDPRLVEHYRHQQHQHQQQQQPSPPVNEYTRDRHVLTGGETGPPLIPSIPGHSKPRSGRTVAWQFVPFDNHARTDALKLNHWQRVGTPAEYPFARFNKPVRSFVYTEQEYANFIAPKDTHDLAEYQHVEKESKRLDSAQGQGHNEDADQPQSKFQKLHEPRTTTRRAAAAANSSTSQPASSANQHVSIPAFNSATIGSQGGSIKHGMDHVPPERPWNKEQTDYLFELVQRFDLRFPVIHDRWPYERYHDRSIDELKNRYYSVAKTILDHRNRADPGSMNAMPLSLRKHCQAITMNPFDYEYECIRKNQLEYQYSRSKHELREEEETVREARRIEANRRRNLKERQRLLKLLAPTSTTSTTSSLTQSNSTPNALNMYGSMSAPQAAADNSTDPLNTLAAASILSPPKTFPHRKVSYGPFARSSHVFAPVSQSSKVCKRVDAGLEELNVTLRPMPTVTVVDNFDLLRIDILNILELNRTVAKKEEEVYSLRVKLAKAKGDAIPPPPPGVPLSHKKRRIEEVEVGPIFGGRVSH